MYPKLKKQKSITGIAEVNKDLFKAAGGHRPSGSRKHCFKSYTWLSKWDMFGEQISFTWNGEENFKTGLSFFCSLVAYSCIFLVVYNYFSLFIMCTDPNVYMSSSYNYATSADPINLHESIYPQLQFIYYHPTKKTRISLES